MTRILLTVVTSVFVSGTALAQYSDAPPSGYAPPPSGPPSGYYRQPGSYPSETEYVPPAPSANLQGFALSIALGYGTAFGDLMKDDSGNGLALSDGISGQVPFVLGIGYRVNPLFSFGLALQYAALATKNCDTGASCSASDTRIGVEARLHFLAEQPFSPWISGGLGYESFSLSESGAIAADASLTGVDFDFQVGGDIRVNPTFTLGPFLGVRTGTYSSVSSSGSTSVDIPDANQSAHGWITFGVRGAFTL